MCVVLLTACGGDEYVSGDGQLVDQGLFAYFPRYRVSFPEISEAMVGSKQLYRFENLPQKSWSMWVLLAKNGESCLSEEIQGRFIDAIKEESTELSATVRGVGAGSKSFNFSGRLEGDWLYAGIGCEFYYRSDDLEEMSLSGEVELEVELTNWSGLSDTEGAALKPTLVAGGFEI